MSRALLVVAIFLSAGPAAADPPSASKDCRAAYQPVYALCWDLPSAVWQQYCLDSVAVDDIIAIGVEHCVMKYDAAQCEPIGLSHDAWIAACKGKLAGLTPEAYVKSGRKAFVLSHPASEIKIGVAELFVAETASDGAPDVVAARQQLLAILGRARAVRDRFGKAISDSAWNSQPLSISGVSSGADFEAWAKKFDLGAAHSGTLGDLTGVVAGLGTSLPSVNANDNRPLHPGQSMGGVDQGLDRPEVVKQQLAARVQALGKMMDENGKSKYPAQAISLMADIVDTIPINAGPRKRTDPVALEDAMDMVAAVEIGDPAFVWSRDISGLGLTRTARGTKGELLKTKDGRYRDEVTLKPGPKGSKEEYSFEQQAGTLLHEVGGHVHHGLDGTTENARVDELNAFYRQFRYYENKRLQLTDRIETETQTLERDRASLKPNEVKARQAKLDDLIKKRDGFLEKYDARTLSYFRENRRMFEEDVSTRYYGDRKMKPGAVTGTQDEEAAIVEKAAADREFSKASVNGYENGRFTQAYEKALTRRVSIDLTIRLLARDRALGEGVETRDARWRARQRADCARAKAVDAKYAQAQKGLEEMDRRLSSLPKDKASDLSLKRAALAMDAMIEVESRYDACQVH